MTVPVWLNADILSGPVNASSATDLTIKPVEPHEFLTLAATVLPESTLSIGWTTRYLRYSQSQFLLLFVGQIVCILLFSLPPRVSFTFMNKKCVRMCVSLE